jgi:hypothetical protein
VSIVLAARDGSFRTRQELAGWAAANRAKVDALAADMVESANRDADAIRAEALRTSMAEAEETARAHIAEAAERAQQEADAIRDDARQVLHRALELGDEVTEAFEELTTGVGDTMTRLHESRVLMEQLLAENRAPDDEPGDAESDTDAEAEGDAQDDVAGEEDDEGTEPSDESDQRAAARTTTRPRPTTYPPTPKARSPRWTSRWTASSGPCSGAMVSVASEDWRDDGVGPTTRRAHPSSDA